MSSHACVLCVYTFYMLSASKASQTRPFLSNASQTNIYGLEIQYFVGYSAYSSRNKNSCNGFKIRWGSSTTTLSVAPPVPSDTFSDTTTQTYIGKVARYFVKVLSLKHVCSNDNKLTHGGLRFDKYVSLPKFQRQVTT